jgi:hypothetical protein
MSLKIDPWMYASIGSPPAGENFHSIKSLEAPRVVIENGQTVVLQRVVSILTLGPSQYRVKCAGEYSDFDVEMPGSDVPELVRKNPDEYLLVTYYNPPAPEDLSNLFSGGVELYQFRHEDTLKL